MGGALPEDGLKKVAKSSGNVMQLYALDQSRIVLAGDAEKHKNYQCPECMSAVRLRKGPHRQPHFFHLSATPTCRQHQKSLAHLHLQLFLLQLLPEGEAEIEKPFPSINRIADVAWEEQKIVFEIQCSSLSMEEAKQRCLDYKSVRYTPVWILHDKRFNKKYLSAAENYLRSEICFFCKNGSHFIYDQFDICQKSRRLFRSKWLPVDLSRPTQKKTSCTFKGSLADRLETEPSFKRFCNEKTKCTQQPPLSLISKFRSFYLNLLHLMLEALSKKK